MNSHELIGVVDAGGKLGVRFFLGGHFYHLILLCSNMVAVSFLAVVPGAPGQEPSGQLFLFLSASILAPMQSDLAYFFACNLAMMICLVREVATM